MAAFRIFIVEDDPWYAETLSYHLSMNPDFELHVYHSGKECIQHLDYNPDLITLDYGLEDMSGASLLNTIKKWNPKVPVIIVSGQNDVAVAIDLLKNGAYDYILKDEGTRELLWNAINRARERFELQLEVNELRNELKKRYAFGKSIIGSESTLGDVFKFMEKALESNINVSLSGETGTGKDLVAKAIHFNSSRRNRPFVAVNMAAIPSELVESELFGYEKGAFTGASKTKKGKFEEANGGTLFLDEIADLSIGLQSKLLRVVQERELTRLGGEQLIKLDVRLIVATHKNLLDEVKAGRFREDLYYRVMGLPINLPPLRARRPDILPLAEHFLIQFSKENDLAKKELSDDAKRKLIHYDYPGNIRELKSIIDLASVLSDGNVIETQDIHFKDHADDFDLLKDEKSLREYTRYIIKHYLEKYNYDVIEVARRLDIGKSTIYKMIKDKEIVVDNL
jgi:DNA-binding NtrC family response regulator